jgi:hypothetical protein
MICSISPDRCWVDLSICPISESSLPRFHDTLCFICSKLVLSIASFPHPLSLVSKILSVLNCRSLRMLYFCISRIVEAPDVTTVVQHRDGLSWGVRGTSSSKSYMNSLRGRLNRHHWRCEEKSRFPRMLTSIILVLKRGEFCHTFVQTLLLRGATEQSTDLTSQGFAKSFISPGWNCAYGRISWCLDSTRKIEANDVLFQRTVLWLSLCSHFTDAKYVVSLINPDRTFMRESNQYYAKGTRPYPHMATQRTNPCQPHANSTRIQMSLFAFKATSSMRCNFELCSNSADWSDLHSEKQPLPINSIDALLTSSSRIGCLRRHAPANHLNKFTIQRGKRRWIATAKQFVPIRPPLEFDPLVPIHRPFNSPMKRIIVITVSPWTKWNDLPSLSWLWNHDKYMNLLDRPFEQLLNSRNGNLSQWRGMTSNSCYSHQIEIAYISSIFRCQMRNNTVEWRSLWKGKCDSDKPEKKSFGCLPEGHTFEAKGTQQRMKDHSLPPA